MYKPDSQSDSAVLGVEQKRKNNLHVIITTSTKQYGDSRIARLRHN